MMHNMNNIIILNLFFPLHDAILFQGHGKSQAQHLRLGVVECKVYHNVLWNTKSQLDFDRLLKGDDHFSNHKCLVEWNDINKSKSWVNYFEN
jgi:hypothetical protein